MESPDGLVRRADGDEQRVDVPVVVVATDRRALFVAADAADREGGVDAGALGYADLVAVQVADGRLFLSTSGGVEWSLSLSTGGPGVTDPVVRHLRWIGDVRSRLVAVASVIGRVGDEIRDLAAAANWEAAETVYDQTRGVLDRTIGAVQRVRPVEDDVLAPRLTTLERTLEAAYVAFRLVRAEARLSLAQQLVEGGDAAAARLHVEGARDDYLAARYHVPAVERTDQFRFGQQRSVDERVERLRREVEEVAAGPPAGGAEAEDTAPVDPWERTARAFVRVLEQLTRDDAAGGPRPSAKQ